MAKMMRKARRSKGFSACFVVLLTVVYLLMTAAVAQKNEKENAAGTGLSYQRDELSYGDLWAFTESEFNQSKYSSANEMKEWTIYTSSANKDATTAKITGRQYYGTVTITNKVGLMNGVPIVDHALTDFVGASSEVKKALREGAIPGEYVPVVTTQEEYGLYTVVPNAAGDYRLYVYSKDGTDPSDYVRYHVVDGYEGNNAYPTGFDGTADTGFTATQGEDAKFTRVSDDSNWYFVDGITVDYVSWTAVSVDKVEGGEAGNANDATDTVDGKGTGVLSGAGVNTVLNSDKYYCNKWTTSKISYNSLIVLQWDSSMVDLGPLTKASPLNINNGSNTVEGVEYTGTITAQNIFGEPVTSGDNYHAPVYLQAEGEDDATQFDGFEGLELTNTTVDGEVYYIYKFEGDESDPDAAMTVTGKWTKLVPLPTLTVTGGDYSASTDFYTIPALSASNVMGTEQEYILTAEFGEGTENATVEYVITKAGAEPVSGVLTAEEPSVSVVAKSDKVSVKVTATNEGTVKEVTVTILPQPAGASYVAQNITQKTKYYYVEDALMEAKSEDTIVLLRDAAFSTDTVRDSWLENNVGYTIKSGVTLLLPFAEGEHDMDEDDKYPYANYALTTNNDDALLRGDEYRYLQLTIPEGITLQVEGKLIIGGKISSATGIAGATTGSYSEIVVEEDAKILLKSNAILSVCGYIVGEGSVETEEGSSGAEIYQPMVVADFRGGNYTASAGAPDRGITNHPSDEKNKALAPFLRYTIQNVQAGMTLRGGNSISVYCNLYANSQHNQITSALVGTGTGLLSLNENAVMTATYHADEYVTSQRKIGRTRLVIEGGASLGNMPFKMVFKLGSSEIPVTMNTSDMRFGIPYNYDITLDKGNYTIQYGLNLLPGSRMTVTEDAVLTLTSEKAVLTVFDGLYDHTGTGSDSDHTTISYGGSTSTSTVAYPRTMVLQAEPFSGTGAADLVVNGTLNITNKARVGGLIQTSGTTAGVAEVFVDSDATQSVTTQVGLVGDGGIVEILGMGKHHYAAGATVRTLKGMLLEGSTGRVVPLTAGRYFGMTGKGFLPTYTYDLYTNSADLSAKETHIEDLNAMVEGAWYNCTATIHAGDMTFEEYYISGADVSQYYTDSGCTTKAGTITGDMTLYAKQDEASAVARLESGESTTYFASLVSAVNAATVAGDRVVLMQDIAQLNGSVLVQDDRDIEIDLDGHSITYEDTPFTNAGTLRLVLGADTVLAPYSGFVAAAVTNGQGAEMELVMNGGQIIVDHNTADKIVSAAVKNNGDMTIDMTNGGGRIEVIHTSASNKLYRGAIYNTGMLSIQGDTPDNSIITNHNANLTDLKYATTAAIAKTGKDNYDGSVKSTIVSSKDYLCGIYNQGTMEEMDKVSVYGAYNGIYNGNNTAETVAHIGTISDSVITGGYQALLTSRAEIEYLLDTVVTTEDSAMYYGDPSPAGLYLYSGHVGVIDGCTFSTPDMTASMFGADGSKTIYTYKSSTVANDYTHTASRAIRVYTVNGEEQATIGSITDSSIHSGTKNYGLDNDGGHIELIENVSFTGRYGLRNMNCEATTYSSSDNYHATLHTVGTIDIIRDCTIDVNRYGIVNRGVIGTICGGSGDGEGTTITVTPDTAKDDTPDVSKDPSDESPYAIYNGNNWFNNDDYPYNEKRVEKIGADGKMTRTVTYTEKRPTIGAITGNVTISGYNTTSSNSYGITVYNTGNIDEISGNITIQALAHKTVSSTTASTLSFSRYALVNRSGGYIGKIEGGVEDANGNIVGGITIKAGGMVMENRGKTTVGYYGKYSGSDNSGYIMEYIYDYRPSEIGSISGKVTITTTEENTGYANNALINYAKIGSITGDIYIHAHKDYALANEKYSDDAEQRLQTVMTRDKASADATRTYEHTYFEPSIELIDGGGTAVVNATVDAIVADGKYAVQNKGSIGSIKNVFLKGGGGYALCSPHHGDDVDAGDFETLAFAKRTTIQGYKSGVTESGENAIYTEYVRPHIGTLDGLIIRGTSYVLYNGGTIDLIQNCDVEATGGTRALSNSRSTYKSITHETPSLTHNGSKWVYSSGVKVYDYSVPLIDKIGGGNRIVASGAAALLNRGIINTIDSGDKTTTLIRSTGGTNSSGLHNVEGQSLHKEGSTITERHNARIGTIKNVQITGVKYGIYCDGTDTYTSIYIGELGENALITSSGTDSTGSYAVYLESNSNVGLISGGYYRGRMGGTASRTYAIYLADTRNYGPGKTLSSSTVGKPTQKVDGTWSGNYKCYYVTNLGSTGAQTVTGGGTPEEVTGDYKNLASAIAAFNAMTEEEKKDTYIVLVADTTETASIKLKENLYLDLNGHTVNMGDYTLNLNGYKLSGMDSTTNAYASTEGGIVGTVSGTVPVIHTADRGANNGKQYVMINGENGMEFHRFNIKPTAYSFFISNDKSRAHLAFQASFKGTAEAKEKLADIGFKVNDTDYWYGGVPTDIDLTLQENMFSLVAVDYENLTGAYVEYLVGAMAAFEKDAEGVVVPESVVIGYATEISLADALAAWLAQNTDNPQYSIIKSIYDSLS